MSRTFLSRVRFYCRALNYFRQDGPLVGVWVLLVAGATGLGLLSPWPLALLADHVLGHVPVASAVAGWTIAVLPQTLTGKIVGLAVLGLLIKVAGDALGVAQSAVSNRINYNGLLRIRSDLFRKLQAMSLGYHRSQPQGDAIYRLVSDVYGAQSVLGVLVSTLVAAGTLAVMTVVLAQRSLTLTALAFSVAPLLAIVNVAFGRKLKHRTVECKKIDSRFTAEVQQSMACMSLVQAFGREDDAFANLHGTMGENVRAWWRLNRAQFAYQILTALLFGLGGAAIFGYGGLLVARGTLTIGDLFVFSAYLGMLWGPLSQLTGFVASLQGGAVAVERVFEVLDCDHVIADKSNANPLPMRPRTLELHDVRFAYGDGPNVLDGLDVRILPGQTVAFVGASGTGKSTLLNLIPRFYDPTAGRITLDGVDARDVAIKDLRRHVALVLQETVMLPTTIADNIAYGRPDATREQIMTAARMAGAHGFIEQVADGYDTALSESGANLSGGQRQRIAIARALLTEAPFVVLDEPTSALDPLHERLVTQTLDSLKGQRTIILVSHRLSTVVNADQIFVMDNGQIVEAGTHDELVARGGLYAAMAAEQFPALRLANQAA